MAFIITASSLHIGSGCFLTNKTINFSFSNLSDLVVGAGPWQMEQQITDLATAALISGPALFQLDVAAVDLNSKTYSLGILNPGNYTIQIRVYMIDGGGDPTGNIYTSTLDFTVCPVFDIIRDKCYQYHLWRPSGNDAPVGNTVYDVKIVNGSDTYESNYSWDVAINNQLQFNLPDDGVYTFTMSQSGVLAYTFYVYEFCRLTFCFQKLVTGLWCGIANDPCCKSCNDEIKKNLNQIRLALNKIIALTGQLFLQVYNDQIKYMGLVCLNDCRDLEVKQIASIFDSINVLTLACGAGCGQIGCQQEFLASCNCSPASSITSSNLI